MWVVNLKRATSLFNSLSNVARQVACFKNECLTWWIWDTCDALRKDESENKLSSWRRCFFIPNSSFAAGVFQILWIFKSINLPVLLNSFGGSPRQNLSLLFKGIEIWCERGEVRWSLLKICWTRFEKYSYFTTRSKQMKLSTCNCLYLSWDQV